MPEIVVSSYGRYELVQSGGGLELRESVEARRRARWAVGGMLLGAATVIWQGTGQPFAVAPAILGAALVIAGLRKKGRRLLIADTEIAWGYTGDDRARSTAWPRAEVGCVHLSRGSRLADPKLRRRRPVWMVRLRSREGALHPAVFVFSTESPARGLAQALARHLGAPLEVAEAIKPDAAQVTPGRRAGDRRSLDGTAPRPGRLDPR